MNNRLLIKFITDAVSIAVVGLPVLTLFLAGEPYHRGFYCDDDSIRYPYKDSTVSNPLLYTYAIGLPVITILVIEALRLNESRPGNYGILGLNVYCNLVTFAFGALVSQLLTDIAKYSIGRLRPHFYQVCKPTIPCLPTDDHTYHYQYQCNGEDLVKIRDARLSFMSGHSSFSAFCMVYLALYLQVRIKSRSLGLVKPLFQVLLIYSAIYIGLSRISDYKHHWSDVLIGLLQGSIVAIIIAYYVSDLFKTRSPVLLDEEAPRSPAIEVNEAMPINYNSCALEQMQKSN